MSLYAIKNGRGEWYDWNDREFWPKDACAFVAIGNHEDAERMATEKGGHVVELAEKPAPIVVSEAEAEMLKRAKDDYCAASVISAYSTEHIGAMGQERLMRAYVNGWTVEKPKRYLVFKQLPGKIASNADDAIQATRSILSDKAVGWEFRDRDYLRDDDKYRFTDAEIENYGLQDCEKQEVTNED